MGNKNRYPYLTNDVRPNIIQHIRNNAKSNQIYIDTISGYDDHLHCFFGLNADMSISKVMQLIKGESAFWINKEKFLKQNLNGLMNISLYQLVNQ